MVNGERVGTLTFTSFARIDGKIVIPERLVAAGKGEMEIRFNVPAPARRAPMASR